MTTLFGIEHDGEGYVFTVLGRETARISRPTPCCVAQLATVPYGWIAATSS